MAEVYEEHMHEAHVCVDEACFFTSGAVIAHLKLNVPPIWTNCSELCVHRYLPKLKRVFFLPIGRSRRLDNWPPRFAHVRAIMIKLDKSLSFSCDVVLRQ